MFFCRAFGCAAFDHTIRPAPSRFQIYCHESVSPFTRPFPKTRTSLFPRRAAAEHVPSAWHALAASSVHSPIHSTQLTTSGFGRRHRFHQGRGRFCSLQRLVGPRGKVDHLSAAAAPDRRCRSLRRRLRGCWTFPARKQRTIRTGARLPVFVHSHGFRLAWFLALAALVGIPRGWVVIGGAAHERFVFASDSDIDSAATAVTARD